MAVSKRRAPLDDGVIATLTESRTLAALRDTLLPKLISGELRAKDAARFVVDNVSQSLHDIQSDLRS